MNLCPGTRTPSPAPPGRTPASSAPPSTWGGGWVGAVKNIIQSQDDVEIFAQHQYAVRDALCLCSDVPELLEEALRVYQGRAFYDGTGGLERRDLDRLAELYGLIVL